MRVMGVDPGLTRCGLGVVDGAGAGRRATLVEVGVARTPADDDVAIRLRDISVQIE
jgi:crossover junction endodeoxyribonuclease RuvC